MSLFNKAALEQFANNGYNVLFSGKHGVGKTSVVKAVFESLGYRWKYFSASTLDVWVDLVGVPDIKRSADGPPILELVRPQDLATDEVDAIFFDELNRAPDKVLNAVMELIQFGSINGYKFKNLKCVWAAVNPADENETYRVNLLDPALRDRFHVHIDVPFKLDEDYLLNKYPTIAPQFIEWWNGLPVKSAEEHCSPRRLDYAMDAFSKGINIDHILHHELNLKKLRDELKTLPFIAQIAAIQTAADAEKFLNNVNNATKILDLVKQKDPTSFAFFKKYKNNLPRDLVEACVDHIESFEAGNTQISSFERWIMEFARASQSPVEIANAINSVDFGLYSKMNNNSTLLEELTKLNSHAVKQDKLRKILVDLIRGVNNPKTHFWKDFDRKIPSNVQNLLLCYTSSQLSNPMSDMQMNNLNDVLFKAGAVSTPDFLKRSR